MRLRWAVAIFVWLLVIYGAAVVLATLAVALGVAKGTALLLAFPSAATMGYFISIRRRQPPGETMMLAGIHVRMYFTDDPSAAVLGWQPPKQRRGDSLGEGMITRDGTDDRRVIIVWSERRNMIEGFDQPLRMTPGDRLDVKFNRTTGQETRVSRMHLFRTIQHE